MWLCMGDTDDSMYFKPVFKQLYRFLCHIRFFKLCLLQEKAESYRVLENKNTWSGTVSWGQQRSVFLPSCHAPEVNRNVNCIMPLLNMRNLEACKTFFFKKQPTGMSSLSKGIHTDYCSPTNPQILWESHVNHDRERLRSRAKVSLFPIFITHPKYNSASHY